MTSKKLRQEFLSFLEKNGHKIVASSSLIPTDPSVLLTSAGMQQFKPYYLGEKSPYGSNVVTCQKCFRTSDIEEVGDDSHLTFLEMLGNFSFGGYFKEEAIKFAYQFLFEELKLPIQDAVFTIFQGDKNVPEDKESAQIWKKLGAPGKNIKKCGKEDNFWGPTGEEGPCGPTTEIHILKSLGKGEVRDEAETHRTKGIEVWNLVFNEYYQDKNGKLTFLKQKGVDTGMGLERLAMISQKKNNVFETDLFEPIVKLLPKTNVKAERIIADHVKGAVFLITEGITPSNVEQGYILRRVLRRAITYGKQFELPKNFLIPISQKVIEIYKDIYPELKSKEAEILTIIQNEEEGFEEALVRGIKEVKKIAREGNISGDEVHHIQSTYGVPPEIIEHIANEMGVMADIFGTAKAIKKHQEISRAGAEKKFGGVGKEATMEATMLHTATHLLHAALREVLGKHVQQMGSDITSNRLRFDFSHPEKTTEAELKKVTELVNQKIKQNLEIKKEEMKYEDALKSGALAFFKEKYPEVVTVYTVEGFSREICAGPHVKRTGELGLFEIIKEESSGAGVRRIRAILK